MSPTHLQSPRVQLAGMLGLAAIVFVAFWIGEGLAAAWPPLLILLAFALLVHVGRSRSQTVEVMGGIGDERTQALYVRAGALTTTILSFVLPAWWLVTVARGEVNETLTVVCALFGTVFVLASLALAARG